MSDGTPAEPPTAPEHSRWYNLALGSTFKDDSANRLCSLRYEFKPASIDKTKPGSMHKRKDNRVSVEFQNNQPGRPKVVFEGSSEDYKENEAVLIFDGVSFRLERLHRSVKQLRHVRLPGDSAASVSAHASTPESRLSPVIKPGKGQQYAKAIPPAVPVEVERIDVGEPAISGAKSSGRVMTPLPSSSAPPENSALYDDPPNNKRWEVQDMLMEDIFGSDYTAADDKVNALSHNTEAVAEAQIPSHRNDSEDEIADVDDDDDEATRGLSAAEALRAQVLGEAKAKSSSSSSTSGTSSSSSSSGSGSASSSSSDSEGSDVNSV